MTISYLKTMAPNGKVVTLAENGEKVGKKEHVKKQTDTHLKLPKEIGTDYTFKRKIVWFNAIGFLIMHLAALYGYYLCFQAKFLTILWSKYDHFLCTISIIIFTS